MSLVWHAARDWYDKRPQEVTTRQVIHTDTDGHRQYLLANTQPHRGLQIMLRKMRR
jgi:hypothetical protein